MQLCSQFLSRFPWGCSQKGVTLYMGEWGDWVWPAALPGKWGKQGQEVGPLDFTDKARDLQARWPGGRMGRWPTLCSALPLSKRMRPSAPGQQPGVSKRDRWHGNICLPTPPCTSPPLQPSSLPTFFWVTSKSQGSHWHYTPPGASFPSCRMWIAYCSVGRAGEGWVTHHDDEEAVPPWEFLAMGLQAPLQRQEGCPS